MSFEDRPRSTEHDANALLFTHAAAVLQDIGPAGYAGKLELPIRAHAASALWTNPDHQLAYMVKAPIAAKHLILEIGDGETGELKILSVTLPIRSRAAGTPRSIIFERSDDAKLSNVFLPSLLLENGTSEPAKNIPFVPEVYIHDLLKTARYDIRTVLGIDKDAPAKFPDDPLMLQMTIARLLSRADTYTMHRQKEFAIDTVLSLRVASTVNRIFEPSSPVQNVSSETSGKSKQRAAKSQSARIPAYYRHEDVLEVTVTEFEEAKISGFPESDDASLNRSVLPPRPISTQTVRFEGSDHSVDSVQMETRYELDPDNPVTFRHNSIKPSVALRLATVLAAYREK